MSPSPSSTPARLTALATSRLPRWSLFVLIGLYLLLGLFDRDPWKSEDVVTLASALTAAQEGGLAWLFPHIGNIPFPDIGPWSNWFNALLIKTLGFVTGPIAAVRFGTLLWMSLCLATLWYATYLAGRRPEAQPLALPFGGEPKEAQYGRLLADISVLFLIGTVGIVLRTHETSVAPVLMACQGLALLGTLRLIDKPRHAAYLLVGAIAIASLTLGAGPALALLGGVLLSLLSLPVRTHFKAAIVACVAGLAPFVLWWLSVRGVEPKLANMWWQANGLLPAAGPFIKHLYPVRDLPWFIWPTWPLALLAMWNWRKSLLAPHIWIPTAFIICQSIAIVVQRDPGELHYVALTVPCAMLAAFSIPTLRRGVVNSLDWFALMYFSVMGLTVWLGWLAQQTGIPRGIAARIARETVGYHSVTATGAIAMAIIVSLAWVAMIVWRLRYLPKAAWRGAWLCAGGLTCTWLLLVLLWMPTVDYVRSYRPMSSEIAMHLQQINARSDKMPCVQSSGINEGARASLYVFDGIKLSNDFGCPVMLQQTTQAQLESDADQLRTEHVEVLWTGSRGADRFDRYRLLLLADPADD